MSDAIDQATAAFDADMGRGSAAPAGGGGDKEKPEAPTERLFDNDHEDDETAGGDDLPNEGEIEIPENEEQSDEEQESDQDGPEGDDDDLSEEERKALAEEDDDPLAKAMYTVTVNGEEQEVSLREALNGYSRTAAFHQGLNQLSEWRGQLETEMNTVVHDRIRLIDTLSEAETLLTSLRPPEPDWDAEYAKDHVAAGQLRKQYADLDAKILEVKNKRQAAVQEHERAQKGNLEAYALREQKRFAAIAGWKSAEEVQKDLVSMKRTALAAGFSEAEINEVYDSRMLNILRKASKYDRMMAARPRPVNNGPTNGKGSGAGRNRTAPKNSKPMAQLRKTGRIDDAVPVFNNILNPQRRR